MMETIKGKEDLYNNIIFEKEYFTNGDMALRFDTIKNKETFQQLIDSYNKSLLK